MPACSNFTATNTSFLGPVYTERQRKCCNNTSNSALIENNAITPKWVATQFLSDSIVFNQNSIASVIAMLSLTLDVYKWTLASKCQLENNEISGNDFLHIKNDSGNFYCSVEFIESWIVLFKIGQSRGKSVNALG